MSVTVPPFPALAWDGYFWTGAVRLASWAGFQSRRGPYGSRDRRAASRGEARLSVHVPLAPDGTPALPDAAQRRAFAYLAQHEAAVAAAIHRRLLKVYPSEREAAIDADDELEEVLPVVKDVAGLRAVVGINTVHVLPVSSKQHAYVGFECGCEWEEEHGWGAMTHRARVVADGHADHAFLAWVAERDRDQRRSSR